MSVQVLILVVKDIEYLQKYHVLITVGSMVLEELASQTTCANHVVGGGPYR